MGDILLASLSRYVPECLVVLTMIALLYFESTYKDSDKGRLIVHISATIGLVFALMALCMNLRLSSGGIFTNAVVIDPFSTTIKMIIVLGTLGTVWLSKFSNDVYPSLKSEFAIMALGILAGGMLLASANNFLTVYLGVETLSILSYALASFKKKDSKSTEAGLKYSLYGALASGIMLFGISHMYGMLGTIQFAEIPKLLGNFGDTKLFILAPAFLCFFVGLGYKIACVPFHMWSPDVYEGSPLPVTAFFSIVPKLAAIAAITRVSFIFFGSEGALQSAWIEVLWIIAALTMTIGNVSAIGQRSVKRMLAYSSISHAGVMLLGIMVVDKLGVRAIVFYGVTYLFMTLVAFYITSFVADEYGNDYFERFSGLVRQHPFMAICMSAVMFSLAGLPPMSGFVAKFNIISTVIDKREYTIAVIAVLNSVVSLYYYMKVVRLMMLKEPESTEGIVGFNFLNQAVVFVMALPVLLLGIFWESLMSLAHNATLFLQ